MITKRRLREMKMQEKIDWLITNHGLMSELNTLLKKEIDGLRKTINEIKNPKEQTLQERIKEYKQEKIFADAIEAINNGKDVEEEDIELLQGSL